MTAHWMETADRVWTGSTRIVGEDDRGDLWVPSKTRPGWWDRPLDLRRPTHWPYWLRSRLTRRLAFLEAR